MFSISDTISRSLKLAWNHKLLWVFALLVGAGGFGTNFSNFGNISELTQDKDQKQDATRDDSPFPYNDSDFKRGPTDYEFPQEQSEESIISKVLGTNASNSLGLVPPGYPFDGQDPLDIAPPGGSYNSAFRQLPPEPSYDYMSLLSEFAPNIVVIFLSVVVFMIFMTSVSIIIRSWALGAFLNGIDAAINGKGYGLKKLGTAGRISVRELVKYKILLLLLTFAVLIVLAPLPILLLIAEEQLFGVLAAFIAFVIFFIYMITVKYSTNFAIRFIALKELKYKKAFKIGLKTFKHNIKNAFMLAFANCFVTMAVSVAAIMIFLIVGAIVIGVGFFAIGTAFSLDNKLLAVILTGLFGIVTVPAMVGFIVGITAFSAYLKTYRNFTWNFLFNYADDPNSASNEKSNKSTIENADVLKTGGENE